MSGFISWICCAIVYLRFTKARKAQGIPDSVLPFRTELLQPWGSYVVIVFFSFLSLINGFDVFFFKVKGTKFNVSGFLTAYIGLPVFLAIYFGHVIYSRKQGEGWARRPEDVDLLTGLQEMLDEEQPAKEHNRPWYIAWIFRAWE
jgi:amino acid transporter